MIRRSLLIAKYHHYGRPIQEITSKEFDNAFKNFNRTNARVLIIDDASSATIFFTNTHAYYGYYASHCSTDINEDIIDIITGNSKMPNGDRFHCKRKLEDKELPKEY